MSQGHPPDPVDGSALLLPAGGALALAAAATLGVTAHEHAHLSDVHHRHGHE